MTNVHTLKKMSARGVALTSRVAERQGDLTTEIAAAQRAFEEAIYDTALKSTELEKGGDEETRKEYDAACVALAQARAHLETLQDEQDGLSVVGKVAARRERQDAIKAQIEGLKRQKADAIAAIKSVRARVEELGPAVEAFRQAVSRVTGAAGAAREAMLNSMRGMYRPGTGQWDAAVNRAGIYSPFNLGDVINQSALRDVQGLGGCEFNALHFVEDTFAKRVDLLEMLLNDAPQSALERASGQRADQLQLIEQRPLNAA